MKDSFFFKHDLHAREDRKFSSLIRAHGYRSYGLAWAVIEMIYEADGRLQDDEDQIAYDLRINQELDPMDVIRAVLSSPLFYRRDGIIGSESADRRIAKREEIRKSKAIAGSKGGKCKANAKQVSSQERRGEEKREEKITDGAAPKAARAAHPTLEAVKEYCSSRGGLVDPIKWFDHYTSNGWKVGRNAMKDWRAAVRTWERSEDVVRVREASEKRDEAAAKRCQAKDCSNGHPFAHGKISQFTKVLICDACYDHEEIKLEAARKENI